MGGVFGFPDHFSSKSTSPGFLSGEPILLFNARSGIKLVVDQLKPGRVWLPSFLCSTILTAIDASVSTLRFYPVGEHLSVISEEFLSDLQPDDLFLCIDYFGFPFDKDLLEEVKRSGCKILRDCSQALFFDFQDDQYCDFHLFSPRKFLGVPDGGVLHAKKNLKFAVDSLEPPDELTLAIMLQALVKRRDLDLFEAESEWFDLFKAGESLFKPGNTSMSELTRVLLSFAHDYQVIQSHRRQNYLTLSKSLGHLALFPVLPPEVVPLGFPVVVPNREAVRARLFENKIYPPIHWDISHVVPSGYEESHALSQRIMTLPCDQRYDENDMARMADCLLELLA